ncbi:MAG: helix-turn-helix transcriptional regulator [Clostridium celatum]|nr:helix-turn-helix transcriptional regulator [Clostridium celatum]
MLKYKRKKLGISQSELAKKLHVDRSYISRIENRKFNNVSVEFIRKISKELKLNPIDVFLFFYFKS